MCGFSSHLLHISFYFYRFLAVTIALFISVIRLYLFNLYITQLVVKKTLAIIISRNIITRTQLPPPVFKNTSGNENTTKVYRSMQLYMVVFTLLSPKLPYTGMSNFI